MVMDKATSVMRFVKTMTEILNNEPEFLRRNKDLQYAYHFKVVSDDGNDVSRFTLGVKNGKVSFGPKYEPDVVITMLESAFFDCVFGRQSIEQVYFAGEADLWAREGNWTQHLAWIKESLDDMEKAIREKLDTKLNVVGSGGREILTPSR